MVATRFASARLTVDVGLPGLAEVPIESGPPRQIEEAVVQEPERRVRHDVVVETVLAGVEVEQVQIDAREPGLAGGERGPVLVGDRGRDPVDRLLGIRGDPRPEDADDATGTALGGEAAVDGPCEPRRSAIGDEDQPRRPPSSRSQSSSSRVDRNWSRTSSRPSEPMASAPTGSARRSMVRVAHSSIESTR